MVKSKRMLVFVSFFFSSYYDALKRFGVTDYSWQFMLEDLKLCKCWSTVVEFGQIFRSIWDQNKRAFGWCKNRMEYLQNFEEEVRLFSSLEEENSRKKYDIEDFHRIKKKNSRFQR
jgi:hypothetical protein